MTTTVLSTLFMFAVLGTNSAPVSQPNSAVSAAAQHLSNKLAFQINNASTPEEHRDLAQHFRREAERQRQKEQRCLEISATYRLHPPRVDAYRNVSTADQYQHLADQARDTARADDQMALLQDKLAEGLAQSK